MSCRKLLFETIVLTVGLSLLTSPLLANLSVCANGKTPCTNPVTGCPCEQQNPPPTDQPPKSPCNDPLKPSLFLLNGPVLPSEAPGKNPGIGDCLKKLLGFNPKPPSLPPNGPNGPNNGCVDFKISFGGLATEGSITSGTLQLFAMDPAPTIYSPQGLQYYNLMVDHIYSNLLNANLLTKSTVTVNNVTKNVYTDSAGNTYSSSQVSTGLASNISRYVKIFTYNRDALEFSFATDSSSATLTGTEYYLNYVLVQSDTNGNPVTANPTYLDLYLGNGDFVRYSVATGKTHSYHMVSGRVLYPSSAAVGLNAIYDDSNTIRQIYSVADGLADIVVINSSKYEIRLYSPENAGTQTDGLYVPTGSPYTVWTVENPALGTTTQLKITKTANGVSEIYLYQYSYNVEDWQLTYPGNLKIASQAISWNSDRTVKTELHVEKSPDGNVAYKSSTVSQKFSTGTRVISITVDPDHTNLQSNYTYYSDGRMATVSSHDGSWQRIQYDSAGRKSVSITPFKNSVFDSAAASSNAVTYSYVPVDSRDTISYNDNRPRTVEEKTLGITTKKTYNAYYWDNGQYVEITEQCATAGAAYGAAGNLRTTKRYYPVAAGDAAAGRLQTETFPDGTMNTYTYEYGTYSQNANPAQYSFTAGTGAALRASIVHGTAASPSGIANKTDKAVFVYNSTGDVVLSENDVYTGSDYARIGWTTRIYDGQHHLLATYNGNGMQYAASWNCCALESETLVDGTQYTYTYDALKRRVTKTKVGIGTQPSIVTTYTYDAANRILSENETAGSLSRSESMEYNLAGQITKRTDAQGRITSYAYTSGINTGASAKGSTTTVTLPGGFQEVTETYCDGQTSAISGNAVIARYFDYGVNSDGSQWNKTLIGSSASARWDTITTDLCRHLVQKEHSGYNGTVTSQNTYNTLGQWVKTSTTGMADTLYVYDSMGNVIRTGLDVNGNGQLDLASTDRIREADVAYDLDNGSWWQVIVDKVYGTDNDDTATTVKTRKRRYTGFSGNTVAESQEVDVAGNVTTAITAIDRDAKTVTQTVTDPSSTVAEQTVTVNGLQTSRRTLADQTYTFGYDALGRQLTATDPRTGIVTAHYDVRGRIDYVYDADNRYTTFGYDDATGRKISMKNALDKYTYYSYDAMGHVVRTWGDTDYPTEKTYDSYGQLTQLKTYRAGTGWTSATWPADPGTADTTNWTYDVASGAITAKTYADGKGPSYTYRVDGKLLTRTWARQNNGQALATSFAYDAATGDLAGVTYSDSTPALGFTYNRLGQQKTVTDAVGTRTFAYNSQLRLTSEQIAGIYNKTLTRNYAAGGVLGRYTGLNIGTEYGVGYGYDGYGRLNQITANGSELFTYGYLANSDLVSTITRPNDLQTTFAYEAHRNLLNTVTNEYDGTTVSGYSYTNDAIGRRTGMGRTGSVFSTEISLG